MKHLILATAGHVDHGKTALIKALTGTDTDRLPEEKARGITIELGFAHLQLGDVSLGIIDVPGHEDFVKNMVAGVGAIDLALIAVAADDGWMPQTEEHLQILEYLGVSRAVIAITKSDLAILPNESIRMRLAGTALQDSPIVPVSVKTGAGLADLTAALKNECAAISNSPDIGKPRLSVDRAFILRGVGTVVTGTLTGGKLRRGDEVMLQPSGNRARIRAIQTHNREVEKTEPGMRTALNLPGVDVERGEVIVGAQLGSARPIIDALVRRSSRLPPNARRIKHGSAARVHHGSANSSARIFFADRDSLGAGEQAIAQLRFDEPVFAFYGDRFILRDSSSLSTLAGALVLDADATERTFRSDPHQQMLAARAKSPGSVEVFLRSQLQRDHVVRRSDALRKTRFMDAGATSDLLIEENWWRAIFLRAAAMIDAEHAAHPNRIGLQLVQLRGVVSGDDELLDRLVADLCANEFARSGEVIHRAAHRPSLPANLKLAGERIRAALTAKPFDPPSRKELATDAAAQQALRFLRDTNELVEISPELVVNRDALEQMRAKIQEALRGNSGATVSDLRQVLGSSRRVVVPLLEYFDRLGVTRRIGDQRVLAGIP